MSDGRRRYCKESRGGCGKLDTEVGPISWGGLCTRCGRQRLNENLTQMEARSGPNWVAWRRAMVASVYPELLDVLDSRP